MNKPWSCCSFNLIVYPKYSTVLAFVLLSTLMAGCAVSLTRDWDSLPDIYRGYAGPELPETSFAKIDLGLARWAEVTGPQIEQHVLIGIRDDERTGYGSIALRPGRYQVKWGRGFGLSFLVDPSMYAAYEDSTEVTLTGGHTYLLHMDRNYGVGYVVFSWIEDESTGDVIYGYKKP